MVAIATTREMSTLYSALLHIVKLLKNLLSTEQIMETEGSGCDRWQCFWKRSWYLVSARGGLNVWTTNLMDGYFKPLYFEIITKKAKLLLWENHPFIYHFTT